LNELTSGLPGFIPGRTPRLGSAGLALLCALACLNGLAGCSKGSYESKGIEDPRVTIQRLLPRSAGLRAADARGWAEDIYEPLVSLDIPPTRDNACAVIAVIQQESGFRVNPVVPNMPQVAMGALYDRAEHFAVPRAAVDLALELPSSKGRTYKEWVGLARTEKDLSDIFEDIIGKVPLGKRFLDGWNPIRTRGPMQVNVEFADQFVRARPYPYHAQSTIREELFTRRGSLYFGVAHLLGYNAPYGGSFRYRFADFNAGQYASRNAAFQSAVSIISREPVRLDGALVPHDGSLGSTERALQKVSGQLFNFTPESIHSALVQGKTPDFEQTPLYRSVFALADRIRGRPQPRALVPDIKLHSPKIKDFSTSRYARSVERHFEQCRNPAWFKGLFDTGSDDAD
jgi:hypothetical protein